ncbi:MAG TPA: ABC transporter permease subunit, partial [Actinomycetota bacterium]|nr:ABC transporter permease subunit [Actinomycetota bacterium]
GIVCALAIVRRRFPGKGIVNAFIDLPLAVSPVVVGVSLFLLYGRGGWFYDFFDDSGIQILFALPSMILVTIFICIPFVIRSVAPVLEELGTEEEDAARTLGASTLQTLFRVILPNIRWGLFYGIALTTARAIGEIGAVLIVSGNLKGKTETATIYVLTAFEERMDTEGYIVALTLAAISVLMLTVIEISKRRKIKEVTG